MEGFYSFCAILMIALASVLILKAFSFRGAPMVAALFMVFVIGESADSLGGIVAVIRDVTDAADIDRYATAAMKVIGIGYCGGICSEVCRELGETGLAKAATLAARLEMLAVSCPFLSEIIGGCLELLGE